MKKLTFLITLLLATQLFAELTVEKPTVKQSHSFAIVVDKASYNNTKDAILAYRNSIEADGLGCYLIVEDEEPPCTIKKTIIDIYKSEKAFEGIALVGDVPVPMIRDAQHLTSAFKMDPERFKKFSRSSIASDRFYEDFDLSFKFLKQDTINTSLYYYSLTSEGGQIIDKEIYSGRIKPPVDDDSKYQLLEEYLNRIAKQKSEIHEIHNMLTFAGHGYHSESLASWEWDLHSMREQFPQLYKAGNSIKNLNHATSTHMKKIILTELQKTNLDVALFHAHGSDDTQYLNGYPVPRNTAEYINSAKLFFRSKIQGAARRKKDINEYKDYYVKQYGVPRDWMENALADSMILADSLLGASLDIYTSDLEGIKTQPKFVMFDECYNGQFFHSPYIAGKYLFSGGRTIATVANTVNVKQDIWADEFLGLMNQGIRVGEWHKTRVFLESHLIGDPTFHFYSVPAKLVKNLYSEKNEKYWKKLLKDENPVYRGLAVRKLYEINKDIDQLLEIYNTEESFLVRMQAIKCLSFTRSPEFEELLIKSAYDPAEMIRRITAIWMGKVGREEYLPHLAEMMFYDNSERVTRTAKESMGTLNPEKAIEVLEQKITEMPAIAEPKLQSERVLNSLKRNVNWLNNEIINTVQSDTTYKAKKGALRTLRNYSFHLAIDEVCELILDETEELNTRIVAVEVLGWFTFSYDREEIVKTCEELISQNNIDPILKYEAVKTIKRIQAGSNDPVTP